MFKTFWMLFQAMLIGVKVGVKHTPMWHWVHCAVVFGGFGYVWFHYGLLYGLLAYFCYGVVFLTVAAFWGWMCPGFFMKRIEKAMEQMKKNEKEVEKELRATRLF